MTGQEVFDRVVEHMSKQRGPAINGSTMGCAYRTEDGKSCAIGCLLTDAEAAGIGDDTPAESLARHGLLPERLRNVPVDLLTDLQRAHDAPSDDDGETYLRRWRELMADTAQAHNLSPSKLNELFPEAP